MPGEDAGQLVEPGIHLIVTQRSSSVIFESSLPARFGEFRILIDGQVYAEKGDETYTSGAGLDGGWTHMRTELPLSFFANEPDVIVQQRSAEEDELTSIFVEF